MSRRVVFVVGPPAAGKTTWVRRQASRGDLVIDFDDIARDLGSTEAHDHPKAIRKAAMAEQRTRESAVARMSGGTAYVVRTASDPSARSTVADRVRATETRVVDPGRATVLRRLGSRPESAHREVERWYRLNG